MLRGPSTLCFTVTVHRVLASVPPAGTPWQRTDDRHLERGNLACQSPLPPDTAHRAVVLKRRQWVVGQFAGTPRHHAGRQISFPSILPPRIGPLRSGLDPANRYLDWAAAQHTGPYRDGSGWRIIPVRVTASEKAEITLARPLVVVE